MNHTGSVEPINPQLDETAPESLGDIIRRHPYLNPTKPAQFALLLVDTPGHSIPAIQRLKSALKLLGRGYHLRCEGLVDATGKEVQPWE